MTFNLDQRVTWLMAMPTHPINVYEYVTFRVAPTTNYYQSLYRALQSKSILVVRYMTINLDD